MKRLMFCFACCLMLSACKIFPPLSTNTGNGRYEIIQSYYASNFTFMLDKYEGRVFFLARGPWIGSGESWQISEVENMESDAPYRNPNTINYQIFMGIHEKNKCILVNIHTGRTWRIKFDDPTYWEEMK